MVQKAKKIFPPGMIVFAAQIIMLYIRSAEFSSNYANNPLLYIYGATKDTEQFKLLDVDLWLLNLTLYCLLVIRRVTFYHDRFAYMFLPRYKKYKVFYGKVYGQLFRDTLLYQVFLAAGAYAGCILIKRMGFWVVFETDIFVWANICMMVGNLFLGTAAAYCIFCIRSLRAAILIYPGIPVLSCFLGLKLSVSISSFMPGSWMMIARSDMLAEGGYGLYRVILLEVVLSVIIFWKIYNNREF